MFADVDRYLTLPYRPGVGIMLVNQQNMVFVAKRIDMKSEYWQMPQGGIDDGESPDDAVFRELHEETSVKNAEILAKSKIWFYYDLPDYLITKVWDGKYRGQKQQWYLMRFIGNDDEVNIKTSNPEFSEWRWADVKDLPNIIVPFKKKLYLEIIEEFKQYL